MHLIEDKVPRLKAVRPHRLSIPHLPVKEDIIAFKEARLHHAFKELDGFGSEDLKTSTTDDVILSLVWNNPLFQDIPELSASTSDENGQEAASAADGDGSRAVMVETAGAGGMGGKDPVLDFFKPSVPLDAMLTPDLDANIRNTHGLYKFAISSRIGKELRDRRL